MLDDLFMTILDMSKVASVAILVVLAVRLLLKGAPKVFSYALWAVVLFRLLCPFSIGQTTLSLVPEITPTAETYELNDEPISMADAGSAAYKAIGDALNGGLGVQRIHTTDVEADGSFRVVTADWYDVWILAGQYVWLAVLLVLLLRSGISYRKVKRSIGVSILLRDNIFLADDLGSPFVVGLLRPKIYLPSNLTEEEQSYIILHEQHHIRRGDHIFKALAFIALCLHWFNPLVWVAFILAGKDMEMSCDEAVIRKVGSHVRADYSASLLTLATGRRIIAGTPLAFGEGDTKGRIHNLAKWKKPARWIVILSVVLCLILAVCLLTNPNTYVSATPETIMDSVESDGYTLTVLEATHSENMVSVKALVAVPEDGGSQQPMDVVLRSGSETLKCRSTSTSYDVEAMGAVQYIFLFESAEKPFVDKTFTLSVGGFRATDSADVYGLTQPMEIRWEANTIGDCLSFTGKNDACEVTVEISSIAVRVKVYQTEEIYENINQVQSALEIYDKKGKPVPMQYSGSGSIGGRQAEYTFVVFDMLDINNIGRVKFGNMMLA